MKYNNCYQYYILLEINSGNIIEHKPIKFYKTIDFKQEINNCFHRNILQLASYEPIAVFDISDCFEFEDIKRRGEILNFHRLRLISNLILENCKDLKVAKNNIQIPNEIEYMDMCFPNEYESPKSQSDWYRNYYEEINADIKYNKTYSSQNYLALFYYLAYNDKRYVSQIRKTDVEISLFFEKYLSNKNINFNNIGSAHMSKNYQNFEESKIGETIYSQYLKSTGINSFFINNISTMCFSEVIDMLREYFQGCDGGYDWVEGCNIWDTPNVEEKHTAIFKEIRKWEDDLLNTLKNITKNTTAKFFIKSSFDYPIKQNNFHYYLF